MKDEDTETIRRAAELSHGSTKRLAEFIEVVIAPEDMGAIALGDVQLKLSDAADMVYRRIEERVKKIQELCDHDWKNMGGHEYLEDRCKKCGKSEYR